MKANEDRQGLLSGEEDKDKDKDKKKDKDKDKGVNIFHGEYFSEVHII